MAADTQILKQILTELKLINARLSDGKTGLIVQRLDKIAAGLYQPIEPAVSIEFYEVINGQHKKVDHMFLPADKKLVLAIKPVDKFGNAAVVDGVPQWSVTDASLGDLKASDDGMSAEFVPNGKAGKFDVQVSADADLGEGVTPVLGTLDVEVLAGQAVSVELSGSVE